jgi:dipeptidase
MINKLNFIFATLLIVFLSESNYPCTNFIVTKGASADGSVMITYTADSFNFYGELYHFPAAVYSDGAWLEIYEWDTGKYLGRIPQAKVTYNVVGNMNEYQVVIGETTFGGREELVNPDGIIDYGSLMYIALQRSKTAREAIKVMTELVAEYGYHSSGESFSIGDANEVWIMEMIGKGDRVTKVRFGLL